MKTVIIGNNEYVVEQKGDQTIVLNVNTRDIFMSEVQLDVQISSAIVITMDIESETKIVRTIEEFDNLITHYKEQEYLGISECIIDPTFKSNGNQYLLGGQNGVRNGSFSAWNCGKMLLKEQPQIDLILSE